MKRVTAVGMLLTAGVVANAEVLVGVAGFGVSGTQSLYTIDTGNGQATLIGDTGVSEIAGIEWDGSTLWAYTVDSDVYSLSLTDGSATLEADAIDIVPEGGLAFDASGTLFGVDGSGILGTVDPSTGAFFPLGALGPDGNDVSGIAFDVTSGLIGYAKNGTLEDALVLIDTGSGEATTIGATGIDSPGAMGGLDIDELGTMFLHSGGSLYTVDTGTGLASLVGDSNVGGFSGIVFVPAPGALGVLGAAGLLATRRRR